MSLALEYNKRFGKIHACSKHILWLYKNKPSHFELRESETAYYPIHDFKHGLTRIPACMPDKYKVPSIIESYKLYYTGEKEIFARYTSCLLYTSPSPRDQRGSRMPTSA